MQPRILEVRTQILKKNDTIARAMRDRFQSAGVYVVSLVSSPGSGKTTFLRDTLKRLRGEYRVAALVGDGDSPRATARATLIDVIDVLAPIDEHVARVWKGEP